MKVTNWQRWTRFKKVSMLILVVLGIGFMGGMENSEGLSLGVVAILCMVSAVGILFTIHENEW